MKNNKIALVILFVFCLSAFQLNSQNRTVIDLSSNKWVLALDTNAKWQNEELYVSPTSIENLPQNFPSGGWDALSSFENKEVTLPATVEQHFWGWNGETFGVTGNYMGVSWFTTDVFVPDNLKGKRIILDFESVRFRAEIFVNRQLCGYDLVNMTPFNVDITDYVESGKTNNIAIRITDPNGNFNWKDSQTYMWGKYRTNPSHGFGGITGKVSLIATDKVYIGDVFVKNQPQYNEVEVEVTIDNQSRIVQNDKLILQIKEHNSNQKLVYSKEYPIKNIKEGISKQNLKVTLKNAKLWDVNNPNLYDLSVSLTNDKVDKRFGFRWFEVKDVNGDKQFFLNGKRIVLRTSISWGFWPVNGLVPDDELAHRQISIAKELGLNMLNFHRNLGQSTKLFDYADELGLLLYEEPGGNQYPANQFNATDPLGKMQADFYFKYRNEKLARMIKRDRSHPSLIIYNMHNERGAYPQEQDSAEMRMGHNLDPTRIMTYNSSNGENPIGEPNTRFKLHLLPYDTTFHDYGWWDRHHAGGPGVYHDNLYVNPTDYLRYKNNKDEIIFFGEDGAIGTPPRLQLIREEIMKNKTSRGWEADDYLKWYDAYDNFLKKNDFSKVFPNVDSLTKAMGNVSYYYQGRIIENIRINNMIDGYAINGWESMKLENHSGIVDNYRFPKGNTELISRYNKPLFIAVKMNRKVLEVKGTTTVDFFIVNEVNLKGKYTLQVKLKDASGKIVSTLTKNVSVTGGNTYGECLFAGWQVIPQTEGYSTVEAELIRNNKVITKGDDKLFAINLSTEGIFPNGSVADTTGVLSDYLKSKGINLSDYKRGTPEGNYLVVGAFEPQQWGSGMSDIIEWVHNGNTLIVIDNPERWAEFLADKEVADYRGSKVLGKSWYGGNFFVREHPLFNNLPQNCVFNWEYQCFAAYNRRRLGMRFFNGETIVGCVSDHKKEVYSALSLVRVGRGQVIITSLDIPYCLSKMTDYSKPVDIDGMNEAMNTFNNSSQNSANIVGQQLLLNMLRYASK